MMEDKQQAFKDLQRFKKFTDSIDVEFWLDWGTLLGAVREGKFIEWEQDIDLGFMYKDLEKIADNKEILESYGFRLFPKPEGFAAIADGKTSKIDLGGYVENDKWILQKCQEPNRLGDFFDLLLFILYQYDVNYKYETKWSKQFLGRLQRFSNSLTYDIRKKSILIVERLNKVVGVKKHWIVMTPKALIKEFKEIKFYDSYFNIPFKEISYLEHLYGFDWQTPKNYLECNKWEEFQNVEELK